MISLEMADPFLFAEHDNDSDILGSPHQDHNSEHAITTHFDNRNEWPNPSKRFFTREHIRKGDGLRGLVYNALIDSKRMTDFSGLSEEEMHYHLHITSIHHGLLQSKSRDVCAMTDHVLRIGQQQRTELEQTMKEALNESIQTLLSTHTITDSGIIASATKTSMSIIEEKMNWYHARVDNHQKIKHPIEYNHIRAGYIEGQHSILENLPILTVNMLHGCAHIPAGQIVNHLLALGLDALVYRVGVEEDWLNEQGEYTCGFIEETHNSVKKMMKNNRNITKDTRVVILKVWSDGFQAFHIKADNDHNNLQLFTLTLKANPGNSTKQHTLPYALCFRKKNHHKIFIALLQEVKALEKVSLRYFGKDKQLWPTIVFLEMISEDYPERCLNTSTAQIGTYTHRWGHSCKYNKDLTPSCEECEMNRIETVVGHRDDVPIPKCDQCLDWWSPISSDVHKNNGTYPIHPSEMSEDMVNFPSVRLSFGLIKNSIELLHQ